MTRVAKYAIARSRNAAQVSPFSSGRISEQASRDGHRRASGRSRSRPRFVCAPQWIPSVGRGSSSRRRLGLCRISRRQCAPVRRGACVPSGPPSLSRTDHLAGDRVALAQMGHAEASQDSRRRPGRHPDLGSQHVRSVAILRTRCQHLPLELGTGTRGHAVRSRRAVTRPASPSAAWRSTQARAHLRDAHRSSDIGLGRPARWRWTISRRP